MFVCWQPRRRATRHWGAPLSAFRFVGLLFCCLGAVGQLSATDSTAEPDDAGSLHQESLSVLILKAGALLDAGELSKADTLFQEAERRKDELEVEDRAALFNDLGRVAIAGDDPIQGARFFAMASQLAEKAQANAAGQRYRLNHAKALLARGSIDGAVAVVGQLFAELTTADGDRTGNTVHSKESSSVRLGVGSLLIELAASTGESSLREQGVRLLQQLESTASTYRIRSYASGVLAETYEDMSQWDMALLSGRKAAQNAQLDGDSVALMEWEWLIARSLDGNGNPTLALEAYRRALAILELIRPQLVAQDQSAYTEKVGPIYRAYADLLLRSAVQADAGSKVDILVSAQSAIEKIKVAEVEDFLGSQCLDKIDTGATAATLDKQAVVIYPVVLEERTEILLSGSGALSSFVVPAGAAELTALTNRLRSNLQAALKTDGYLEPAKELYRLLIKPLEAELNRRQASTLVVVADGALRTIPFGVLHDGNGFLVERYSIGSSIGLSLTEATELKAQEPTLLAGGLSEAVQGFQALPGVTTELDALEQRFGSASFRDADFTSERLRAGLAAGGYEIAHLATHGKFDGSYSDSYLLTHDSRVDLSQISESIRARTEQSGPLDLLVMSACETAAGDDRAALGLAGVALNAGARSALATLWAVEDSATAALIPSFYDALTSGDYTKAESLRMAQLQLIATERFQHPSSWSPFLMIGNWL